MVLLDMHYSKVDFAPPLDYVEPSRPAATSEPQVSSKNDEEDSLAAADDLNTFKAFRWKLTIASKLLF